MTKANELELLDKTIAAFGQDSYIGPWLAEIKDSLVADIRNDFAVSAPMPSEARKTASDVLASLKAEVEKTRAETVRYCKELREKADKDIQESRQFAASRLEEMARKVRY